MFARLALAITTLAILTGGTARAQDQPPAPAQVAEGRSAHAGSPIAQALDEFDFGDYESVVTRLRPIVDAPELSRELPQRTDRLEALRIYGIACTLTNRRTTAEGAFLLLLREEPSTRLDPALVRPEAVAFFDEVRTRHRDELLAAYRKTRPKYYWALDLIPLAGQFQNRQWKKAVLFGSLELALFAGNLATGLTLDHYKGDHLDFKPDGHDYTNLYAPLQAVNIACFVGLLVVTSAGIIDAFVVGKKRQQRERLVEARLGL
jgi:hypothetical protein